MWRKHGLPSTLIGVWGRFPTSRQFLLPYWCRHEDSNSGLRVTPPQISYFPYSKVTPNYGAGGRNRTYIGRLQIYCNAIILHRQALPDLAP